MKKIMGYLVYIVKAVFLVCLAIAILWLLVYFVVYIGFQLVAYL